MEILRCLRLLLLKSFPEGGTVKELAIREIRKIRGLMKRNGHKPAIRNLDHNHDAAVLWSAVSVFFFIKSHPAFWAGGIDVLLFLAEMAQAPDGYPGNQKRTGKQGVPDKVHPPCRSVINIPRTCSMDERWNEIENAHTVSA
jgi:hypothetical protein